MTCLLKGLFKSGLTYLQGGEATQSCSSLDTELFFAESPSKVKHWFAGKAYADSREFLS